MVEHARLLAAADALHDAVARSLSVRTRAICEIRVQDVHTARTWAEYAAGVQEALGRPVGCERPEPASLPRIAQWERDLYVDTVPAVPRVDALIRSWRAEVVAERQFDVASVARAPPQVPPTGVAKPSAGHRAVATAAGTHGVEEHLGEHLVDLDGTASAGSAAASPDAGPTASPNGRRLPSPGCGSVTRDRRCPPVGHDPLPTGRAAACRGSPATRRQPWTGCAEAAGTFDPVGGRRSSGPSGVRPAAAVRNPTAGGPAERTVATTSPRACRCRCSLPSSPARAGRAARRSARRRRARRWTHRPDGVAGAGTCPKRRCGGVGRG